MVIGTSDYSTRARNLLFIREKRAGRPSLAIHESGFLRYIDLRRWLFYMVGFLDRYVVRISGLSLQGVLGLDELPLQGIETGLDGRNDCRDQMQM